MPVMVWDVVCSPFHDGLNVVCPPSHALISRPKGAAGPQTLLPVGPQHGSLPTLLSGPQSTYYRSNLEEILCLSFPPFCSSHLCSVSAQLRQSPAELSPCLPGQLCMTDSGCSLAHCLISVSVPSARMPVWDCLYP